MVIFQLRNRLPEGTHTILQMTVYSPFGHTKLSQVSPEFASSLHLRSMIAAEIYSFKHHPGHLIKFTWPGPISSRSTGDEI